MKFKPFLFSGLLLMSGNSLADIYGLVIGIDHYTKPVSSLNGGVNDAKMVAEALKKIGAKEVKLLTDNMATRDNIQKAWQAIVSHAKQDDIVFFTYAGHGAQHPERVKGTEADGQDEFFVLSEFSKNGKNTKERIDDDDLQDWFSKASHLKIILVSDSCHSGTMTRGYKTSKIIYRSTEVGKLTGDVLPIIADANLVDERKTTLKHVLSYSGVPDNSQVPEVLIEDTPHGALSWYLSKGLEGDADLNHDRIIQSDELKAFLEVKVSQETDGQQHPVISLPVSLALSSSATGSLTKAIDTSNINFAIIASPEQKILAGQLKTRLLNTTFTAPEAALLTFDISNKRLQNKFDDTVFALPVDDGTRGFKRVIETSEKTLSPNPDWLDKSLPEIQQVINKYLFVEKIKKLSDGSLNLSLQPDDKLHHQGEVLSLVFNNINYPNFTLFNIASDGTLNYLYPQEQDPLTIPPGKPYILPLEVTPPFGADHFIAITSSESLTGLHEKLRALDSKKGAYELLLKDIEQLLSTSSHYQIGIYSTYTSN